MSFAIHYNRVTSLMGAPIHGLLAIDANRGSRRAHNNGEIMRKYTPTPHSCFQAMG